MANYISTLDLCKCNWQVSLSTQSKPYTAFRTTHGLYQFTVMPFERQEAPATFQRLMDRVLEDTDSYAAAYFDGIVVYSQTWEEHLQHLGEILQRLDKAVLTVQSKKCTLAKPEVQYLGYLLGGGVIRPQAEQIAGCT